VFEWRDADGGRDNTAPMKHRRGRVKEICGVLYVHEKDWVVISGVQGTHLPCTHHERTACIVVPTSQKRFQSASFKENKIP
jgi:hypothetical protein